MHFFPVVYYILVNLIKQVLVANSSGVFLIHTEGCVITAFPEVSESIKKLVGPPRVKPTCPASKLVSSNSTHLWVVPENFITFKVYREDVFHCCYKNFFSNTNIGTIMYGDCQEFSTVIKVNEEHEYVRVECYNLDEKIYDDFFLFPSWKAIARTSYDEESYNILILGIESMSRLNFHRTMPSTLKLLKEKGVVELLGYNKLGDNSFPNLFPLLTGLSFDDARRKCLHSGKIDVNNCTFIWDKFKEYGYKTALGSDSIVGLLGDYEYTIPRIPTDFYLQPFMYETRTLFRNPFYGYHQCMGSKYFYKILLKYIYGTTQQLKLNKLFGIFWEESISHENPNNPHIMDESYYNFLNNLDKDNYLKRTIVILLSDHGTRWGQMLLTEQGRLEGRLPLLGILFPEDFKRRYKVAYKNIQDNANRLTTAFDIHDTLLDLLNPKSIADDVIMKRYNNVSIYNQTSLFLPIPAGRSCSSIGIAEHWCACRKGNKIPVENEVKTIVAQNLLTHINKLINSHPQCKKLELVHIYDVSLIENSKQWRIYSVIVQTRPGNGIFDATIVRHRGRSVVSGTVSRLNLYRNQSYCVDNVDVKMFCYCT